MKNISHSYIDMSTTENMFLSQNVTKLNTGSSSKYYTELGFKISSLRVSVRIPTSEKNLSSPQPKITSYYQITKRRCASKPDKDLMEVADNDWEWKPSPKSSPNTSPKVLRTSTPLSSISSSSSTSSVSLMPYDTFQSPIHRTLKEQPSKTEMKSKKNLGIPVAPPIPPRSKSPSVPPLSAQPPYPSSTVQRKNRNKSPNPNKFVTDQENNRNSALRQYSYV